MCPSTWMQDDADGTIVQWQCIRVRHAHGPHWSFWKRCLYVWGWGR